MKFTTAALVASTAALACASPIEISASDTKPTGNDVFRVMAIRSGSDFQYASLQAVTGGLRINYPKQNSSCSEPDVDYASFSISQEDGGLFLYTANPPIQAYVDRSGMGQGVLRFTTGVQQIGRNQERGPFKVDENSNLVFDAGNKIVGFQACPNAAGGGYSVWLDSVKNPAGYTDCVGFTAKALKEETPIKCAYNGM
jgi:hypothetical protein